MAHSFQLLFRECDYPRIFMAYIGFYSILFFFMFNEFYAQAYKKKDKKVDKSIGEISESAERVLKQSAETAKKLL